MYLKRWCTLIVTTSKTCDGRREGKKFVKYKPNLPSGRNFLLLFIVCAGKIDQFLVVTQSRMKSLFCPRLMNDRKTTKLFDNKVLHCDGHRRNSFLSFTFPRSNLMADEKGKNFSSFLLAFRLKRKSIIIDESFLLLPTLWGAFVNPVYNVESFNNRKLIFLSSSNERRGKKKRKSKK